MKRILVTFLTFIFPMIMFAQTTVPNVTDNSLMNKDGKIYVVVVVLSIILAGIASYLVYLDIKVRKLEKKHNEE